MYAFNKDVQTLGVKTDNTLHWDMKIFVILVYY